MAFIIFVIAFFLISLIVILFMELKPLRHPSQRRISKSSLLRILEDLTAVLFILAFISVFLSWRVSVIRTHPPDAAASAGQVSEYSPTPSESPSPAPSPVSSEPPSPVPDTAASPALPLQVTPEGSEFISSMDYNPENQLLSVTDKDGNVLLYRNVPENIWIDFSNSGSIDGYYLRIIKEKYPEG